MINLPKADVDWDLRQLKLEEPSILRLKDNQTPFILKIVAEGFTRILEGPKGCEFTCQRLWKCFATIGLFRSSFYQVHISLKKNDVFKVFEEIFFWDHSMNTDPNKKSN
jgi:hypothetical protein